MADVHGYELLQEGFKLSWVFIFSVGFDIAYPRKMGIPEPYKRDRQVQIPALFLICFGYYIV